MSYAVRQVVSSDAGTSPPGPTTSTVYEFTCLFSHDLRKKQKRWQDGTLKYHSFNKRVMVYDERGHTVGDAHWGGDEHLTDGDELELDRGNAIVQVGDCVGEREQDLTDVLDRRAREVEKRRQIAAAKRGRGAVASSGVSVGSSAPRVAQQHVPLSAMLQSPGPVGRAVIPQQSPFEMRRGLHSSVEPRAQSNVAKAPPARKRRSISPPQKKGHAQNLFGARLSFSTGPPPELVASRMRALQERNNLQQQRLEEEERESLFVQSSPMESAPTPSKAIRLAQRSAPLLQTRPPRQRTATPEPVEISEEEEVVQPVAPPPKKRAKTSQNHAPLLQTRPVRQRTATSEPEASEDEQVVEPRPKKRINLVARHEPLLKTRPPRPRTVTLEPRDPVEMSDDEQASQSPAKSPPKKKKKAMPPLQAKAFQRPQIPEPSPEVENQAREEDKDELVVPRPVQKPNKKRSQRTDDTEPRPKLPKQKKTLTTEPAHERNPAKPAPASEPEPSGPRAALRIRPKKRRGLLMLAESSNLSEEPPASSLPPLRTPSPEVIQEAQPEPEAVQLTQKAAVPAPTPERRSYSLENEEVQSGIDSALPEDHSFSRLKSPSPVPLKPQHETVPSSLPAPQFASPSPERPLMHPANQGPSAPSPSPVLNEKQASPVQATQNQSENISSVAAKDHGNSRDASEPPSEASVADSPCRERTVGQRNATDELPAPVRPSPDNPSESDEDIQLRRIVQRHKNKLAESKPSPSPDNSSEGDEAPAVRRSTRQKVTRKRKQKTPEPTYNEDESGSVSEDSSPVVKSPSPKGPRFSRMGRKGIRSMEIIGYGETHNKGPAPFSAAPIVQIAGWPISGIGMPRIERSIPKGNLPKPNAAPESVPEEAEDEPVQTEVDTDMALPQARSSPVDVKPTIATDSRPSPALTAEEQVQPIKNSSPPPELSLQDIPAFEETDMDNPMPSKEDPRSVLVPQPIADIAELELETAAPEPVVGLVADPIADSPPPVRRPPALARSSSSLSRGNSSFTTASDLAAAGKPLIANPATRGKKAARKEDAAGQTPQCLVPFEPVRPVRAQAKPTSFTPAILRNAPPRVAGPAPVVAPTSSTAFATGSGGAWSKHAEDLLGMTRPNRG